MKNTISSINAKIILTGMKLYGQRLEEVLVDENGASLHPGHNIIWNRTQDVRNLQHQHADYRQQARPP
jgi:hypothetical protein